MSKIKKTICILITIIAIIVAFFALSNYYQKKPNVENVKVKYGSSSIYTRDDIDGAVNAIKKQFVEFDGGALILNSLTYAGDEKSNSNLAYVNEFEAPYTGKFTQAIVFDSSFHTPVNAGGMWEADAKYTWSWYLGRVENGEWVVVAYGYA